MKLLSIFEEQMTSPPPPLVDPGWPLHRRLALALHDVAHRPVRRPAQGRAAPYEPSSRYADRMFNWFLADLTMGVPRGCR